MATFIIGGSKSISNRLLILQAIYPEKITLENVSDSDDTKLMYTALQKLPSTIDIGHAGTAMRFLTAYLSILEGQQHILTGSQRMQERPIAVLVNALRNLGACIDYEHTQSYPPLRIIGKKMLGGKIDIKGNVSSQYLTALMLIGSALQEGIELNILGEIASKPYLEMTIGIQNQLGIPSQLVDNTTSVPQVLDIENQHFFIESDWSSASYFYSFMALGKFPSLQLGCFLNHSLQADSAVVTIYKKYFGVQTNFKGNKITLSKIADFEYPKQIELDCWNFPDIAQTIAITAVGLKIPIRLTGLDTLKIKETDRILALKNELKKFGMDAHTSDNSLEIASYPSSALPNHVEVKTYDDHRMAMSFAPLLLLTNITFDEPNVVSKSFPSFWKEVDDLLAMR